MMISYTKAPHAALFKRYVAGEFVEVGEDSKFGPIDPETGAEYKALGRGGEHKYSKDYKVGSSYPPNVFVLGEDSHEHDDVQTVLEANCLWSDSLDPVLLPTTGDEGQPEWREGFFYRPIEDAPSLDEVETYLEDVSDDPVYAMGNVVEAHLPD